MIAAIGVDLGGTNIRLVLVDERGALEGSSWFPTPGRGEVGSVVDALAPAIATLRQKAEGGGSQVAAIGVGVAGLTNGGQGVVVAAANIGWKDVPFQAILEERAKLPVLLENDANAAAFAEAWMGAGKRHHSLIVLTLGTGVGGGIVLDGELWRGASGLAGEIGHMVVEPEGEPCCCGSNGCLEAYASATAVVREAKRGIQEGLARFQGDALAAKDVAEAAKEGDPFALEVLARAGRYLGIALASLINIFNPEVIVVGGGMAQAGELILGPARAEARRRTFTPLLESTRIVSSPLGEWAGAIGAAGLALANFSRQGSDDT